MSTPKYNIGQTVFFVYTSNHYAKKIPCPMCFGEKFVTIILGDDSKELIECGFCSHGFERATGQATTWEPHAEIKSGEITGIEFNEGWTYKIGYERVREHKLYLSEEEAIPEREKQFKEVVKQADAFFLDHFVSTKKSQIWSVGYHRGQIKHLEKQIEWHKRRLGLIKQEGK